MNVSEPPRGAGDRGGRTHRSRASLPATQPREVPLSVKFRYLIALGIPVVLIVATIGPTPLSEREDATPVLADGGDRLIFWTRCDEVASLTNEELVHWKASGVDGFVCMVGRLEGMGGDQDFTGDPKADLSGDSYELQRTLRNSRIAKRAAAQGMKLYLGFKLSNYWNTSTPLREWFDDPGWSGVVLPKIRDLAGAARELGFAGLAIDQELYRQQGGAETATWNWDYPGNTHTEAEVRAKATRRGRKLMRTILRSFPRVELAVYHAFFAGDWNELLQEELYGRANTSSVRVDADFWDGLTSVEGYRAIRFWDNTFYKAPGRGNWESALTYNQNRVSATLSRELSNWDYASKRVHVSPFSWIDPGPDADSTADDARSPEDVRDQLLAFRKWGMGGEFANYAYGGLDGFDYSPYTSALQEASSPAQVDGEIPDVTVDTPDGPSLRAITGTAHDNLAIKVVRWRDDRGGSGTAEMSWHILSGDYRSSYEWEMLWSFPTRELTRGATEVTVTAKDIKGNASTPVVFPVP
jgi:hypothetical protein